MSPALKAYGIPGRARLFEVVERVRQVNAERQRRAPGGRLTGKSADDLTLKADASLAVDYLVAPPRMAKYIEVSMQIYGIYLKYISPDDIHTYSIDEVLMDVTGYLETYRTTASRAGEGHDPRRAAHDGHHGDGGHRQQPLSLQGCHGHDG